MTLNAPPKTAIALFVIVGALAHTKSADAGDFYRVPSGGQIGTSMLSTLSLLVVPPSGLISGLNVVRPDGYTVAGGYVTSVVSFLLGGLLLPLSDKYGSYPRIAGTASLAMGGFSLLCAIIGHVQIYEGDDTFAPEATIREDVWSVTPMLTDPDGHRALGVNLAFFVN